MSRAHQYYMYGKHIATSILLISDHEIEPCLLVGINKECEK